MDELYYYRLGMKRGGGGGPGGGGNTPSGGEDWIGDGNTHLWVSLAEGRTSPLLGVGVNGTVTVDWGDGTTPDVLTGTSVSTRQFTPNHEYANPGDYVITLIIDGEAQIDSYSIRHVPDTSKIDYVGYGYKNRIRKAEFGNNIRFPFQMFNDLHGLQSVVISGGVTQILERTFSNCRALKDTKIGKGVTAISQYMFYGCYGLVHVEIAESVASIGDYAFQSCYSLEGVNLPSKITSIPANSFRECNSLASIVIPKGVTSIGSFAFGNCYSMKFYDFTKHESVPAMSATNAFNGIPSDCEIRVPAALVDEWKAATNWSTYADKIVGV